MLQFRYLEVYYLRFSSVVLKKEELLYRLSFIDPSLKLMEWISNPQISLYVTAFVEAYKYLGLYMVIFYAALIGVPDELGEAALIDGASTWQEYLYVRIPYIKPVIIANCLLVLNGSLRSFEFSYLLTHGGPGNASELMTTYMYKQAFSSMKYGYGSSVAIMIVIICMVVGMLFRKFKIKFKGRKFVLNYFLLGLMLPMQVALIPLFTIFNKMGLINTYPAIILPQIAFSLSYSIQLFYSFSKFFPEEMLEAAIIDGCSPIGCFFKMVVPMSLNSIITVATMQAVFCWNEYINAYTFTRSTDMKTITLGLNDFVGSMGLTDWGGTFAAITVTVLPVFIFYFFSSKKMLAGMTAGAVKGINSIYIIREIPENRDHLENHLAGIWQQLLILYITKIKAWQFREEQMKNRISSSLQAVFSRQKDSIIFSIQAITAIIRHLENHLRF